MPAKRPCNPRQERDEIALAGVLVEKGDDLTAEDLQLPARLNLDGRGDGRQERVPGWSVPAQFRQRPMVQARLDRGDHSGLLLLLAILGRGILSLKLMGRQRHVAGYNDHSYNAEHHGAA